MPQLRRLPARRTFSGKRLKARRDKLKLTVNEVLAMLWRLGHKKASPQLLKLYEDGQTIPGLEYALSLASICQCKVEQLTERKGGSS